MKEVATIDSATLADSANKVRKEEVGVVRFVVLSALFKSSKSIKSMWLWVALVLGLLVWRYWKHVLFILVIGFCFYLYPLSGLMCRYYCSDRTRVRTI